MRSCVFYTLSLAVLWCQAASCCAEGAAHSPVIHRTVGAIDNPADLLRPFEIVEPGDSHHGLLRRSANAGLDWYFTSLALVLSPPDALRNHGAHFEQALRMLPLDGSMPLRPPAGLRRISDSAQLWELTLPETDPFAWNCAFTPFPKGAPDDWLWTDPCGRVWRNRGRVAADSHWSLTDTSDDLARLRAPDSHDGTSAVFLLALARYIAITGNIAWLNAEVWRLPPAAGGTSETAFTRIDLIKQMVRHNLLNHMQDGLFRTFRHNRHPLGGQWDVQYLMDNIECRAALRALIPLFENAGHTAFSLVLQRYERELSAALESLTSVQAHAPSYYLRWARQGDWPASGDHPSFYPHIAGQYWAALLEPDALNGHSATSSPALQREVSRWVQMEPHFGLYADWWRQSVLHLDAGLPPYLARSRALPGASADLPDRLRLHINELTPQNSVISDYVAAWQLAKHPGMPAR